MAEIFSFSGRYRILHLTWFAFFLTFVVWFNFAPFSKAVATEFGLEPSQIRAIAFCNVALTVSTRIIVGMVLDRFGPRITYSCLLIYAAIPCIAFASAQSFSQLVISRLALSIVSCGFVISIRMVAAFTLPTVATILAASQADVINWRLAIAGTGIIAALYGVVYYFNIQDTPPGKQYQRPASSRGMEVTTQRDFWFLLVINISLVGILGVLAWRLSGVGLYGTPTLMVILAFLVGLYLFQTFNIDAANKDLMAGHKRYPASDRSAFFQGTFGLTAAIAGIVASTYAFMNLVARPGGGLMSDKIGSRKWTLAVTLAGTGIGYLIFSSLGAIALPFVILMTMTASFFVMATEGATYAIVPLVKPRITGQVAGNVGAYGNVGAVAYLTIYSFLPEGELAIASSSRCWGWSHSLLRV